MIFTIATYVLTVIAGEHYMYLCAHTCLCVCVLVHEDEEINALMAPPTEAILHMSLIFL